MQNTNKIIIEINRCRYYKDLCRKIARPDLAEDLYQEFILALLTYEALPEVYPKEWFRHFAKRIINNLYNSHTSTFYMTYRHNDHFMNYMEGIPTKWAEKPDKFDPCEHDIIDIINKELEKLDVHDREIFEAKVNLNSLRKVAASTRINRKSITATCNKVKKAILNSRSVRECLESAEI